jgi:RNA polymerase sigma factor (sigma-70 family)
MRHALFHHPVTPEAARIAPQLATLLPRLRRFARALTRSRDDADDLVQAAVERALDKAALWQPGTRLDSWMFRLMKNAWIDELRGRQRAAEVLLPEEAGEHAGHDPTAAQLDRLALHKALAQLGDDQRLAVGLVLVEGLSYQEAAAVLEIPIGTLTSRLARGREALLRLLGEAQEAP